MYSNSGSRLSGGNFNLQTFGTPTSPGILDNKTNYENPLFGDGSGDGTVYATFGGSDETQA